LELLSLFVLDIIEILPPIGKYKYGTWRIVLVKCYIDNSVRLRSCIRKSTSISSVVAREEANIFYLSIYCIG
jgi:hypothetical protein